MLTVVLLVAVGIVVLVGCRLMGAMFWERGRPRRVVRLGERVRARCVASRAPATPKGKEHFVVQFTGPDGAPLRFEPDSSPVAIQVGDELTVAYWRWRASRSSEGRSSRPTRRARPETRR